jgi:hypothetical protein
LRRPNACSSKPVSRLGGYRSAIFSGRGGERYSFNAHALRPSTRRYGRADPNILSRAAACLPKPLRGAAHEEHKQAQ